MPVFALLLLAFLQPQPPAPAVRTIGKGPMSGIDAPRQVTIRTGANWSALWHEHAPGGQAMPAVDFSKEMVLGVFLGSRPTSGYGVQIVRTVNASGTLIVQYVETGPAPGTVSAQVVTAPYHLVAVPKHDGEVRFEKAAR